MYLERLFEDIGHLLLFACCQGLIRVRVGIQTSKFWEAARGLVKRREHPLPVSTAILARSKCVRISHQNENFRSTHSPQAPPTLECLSKPRIMHQPLYRPSTNFTH